MLQLSSRKFFFPYSPVRPLVVSLMQRGTNEADSPRMQGRSGTEVDAANERSEDKVSTTARKPAAGDGNPKVSTLYT
ncbi:hypothetical protein [Tortoise microvirus 29]|nr:hypothetical protein [Tortoise microvirus 29]